MRTPALATDAAAYVATGTCFQGFNQDRFYSCFRFGLQLRKAERAGACHCCPHTYKPI